MDERRGEEETSVFLASIVALPPRAFVSLNRGKAIWLVFLNHSRLVSDLSSADILMKVYSYCIVNWTDNGNISDLYTLPVEQ